MYPQVTVNGNEARVVYQDAREGGWDIRFAECDPSNTPGENASLTEADSLVPLPDKYPTCYSSYHHHRLEALVTYQQRIEDNWEYVPGGRWEDSPYVALHILPEVGDPTCFPVGRQFPYGENAREGIEYVRALRLERGSYRYEFDCVNNQREWTQSTDQEVHIGTVGEDEENRQWRAKAPIVFLAQSYPNPFRAQARVEFSISTPGAASLRVYDVGGRLIKTLVEGDQLLGHREVTWDGRDDRGRPVTSGVYFYKLKVGGSVAIRRATLLR